jgi:hypothetical protein
MRNRISKKKNRKGLELECFGCETPITEFGALLFAPPIVPPENTAAFNVTKIHLCKDCYGYVMAALSCMPI